MPTRPRGLMQRGEVWYKRSYEHGREHWRSLRTKDYDTALRNFKTADSGAREDAPRRVTVAQLGAKWIEAVLPTQRNPKNVAMARARWGRYMDQFLGPIPAAKLTGDDIRAFRVWLDTRKIGKEEKKRPLRALTVLHILQDLGACLSWAAEEGHIPRNPFPRRVKPTPQESGPDPFDDSEVKRLITAPEPYGFAIRLLLATGLRWGEACRVLRTDVTADGWLLVQHRTKNRRVRRVPLGREILVEILARKGRLLEPFLAENPGDFSRKVTRRTKVRRFGPQRLKDTFACRFLSAGGNIIALQEILGHQDPMTTRRYGRPSDAFVRSEMEKALSVSAETVAPTVAVGFASDPSEAAKLVVLS